jgi:nitrite reductase/ring-hydroxylating ferredoxin subunit
MAFVKVAKTDDILPGKAKAATVGGKELAIFNVEGKLYAIDGVCPHKGGPLAEGFVEFPGVTCPWHGAIFNLETGAGLAGPCGSGVCSYQTRVTDGDVEVDAG